MALHIPFLHYDIHSIHACVCGILLQLSSNTGIVNATELAREEHKNARMPRLIILFFSLAWICIMICVAGTQTHCVICS